MIMYIMAIMQQITYIAEIDQDVDDLIAARYMFDKGVLANVVLDPKPASEVGKQRVELLRNIGIEVLDEIPEGTDTIFIGGALTSVARYVRDHKLENLVMNGGFVGANVVPIPRQLEKFRGKSEVRTYNFNCDVKATEEVLTSDNIKQIILVGKNVCHNQRNTTDGIWAGMRQMIEGEYGVRRGKLQHDMLACHEGLSLLRLHDEPAECKYSKLFPYNTGLCGNMTKWGSRIEPFKNYKPVIAAVDWIL